MRATIDQSARLRCATIGRALFLALGVVETAIGIWAESLPDSFYRSFPGGGWHWISAIGAYDEHLIRDFGGLSLALAALSIAAAVLAIRTIVATACVAWGIYSVPHLVYHVIRTDSLSAVQNTVNIASLSAAVVVPPIAAALLWLVEQRPARIRLRASKDRPASGRS